MSTYAKSSASTHMKVTHMLSKLGWRSLEDRRLILFYKIVYGYVAIKLPTYFDRSLRYTRHVQPVAFRHLAIYHGISNSLEQTSL